MNNGRYVMYNEKRRKNKLLTVVCAVAAVLFVIISILGLFNPDSKRKDEIYNAVAENAQLKQEIIRLNEQIDELSKKLENTDIDEEDTTLFTSPSPTPETGISPRNIVG